MTTEKTPVTLPEYAKPNQAELFNRATTITPDVTPIMCEYVTDAIVALDPTDETGVTEADIASWCERNRPDVKWTAAAVRAALEDCLRMGVLMVRGVDPERRWMTAA
jgi:hypothetical protein